MMILLVLHIAAIVRMEGEVQYVTTAQLVAQQEVAHALITVELIIGFVIRMATY